MSKLKSILIFWGLIAMAATSWAQDAETRYTDSLRTFVENYTLQIQRIFPTELAKLGVSRQEILSVYQPPATRFLFEVEKKVVRLAELHQLVFEQGQRDKALSSEMNRIESNLVFVTEVGIRNLMHILIDFEKSERVTKKIRTRLKHLDLLSAELSSGEEINSKSKSNLLSLLDIRQTIPGQMLRLGCSYAAQVCIRRKPISDWLNHVGNRGFSQRGGPGFNEINFEKANSLPENALVVVVSNHQDGALDVAIPGRLSERLGLDGGLKLLAHSSNYPAVQYMNQGENLIFTDRGDWQKEALESIESEKNQNRRVGVLVYPEGLVSGPLSQFPLITKVGALSAARKWAHRYAGLRPVYLMVLTTDAHEFSTREQLKPLNVRLESLEVVPTGKPGVPDSWLENQRQKIETLFNFPRNQMADLVSRKKTPGMHGLYETGPVKSCLGVVTK